MSESQKERIANALDGVLEPGETWIVRAIANDILVEDHQVGGSHPSQRLTPELQTRIEMFNDRLSTAGTSFVLYGLVVIFFICVGLHMNWFADWLGPANDKLRSIWVYLLSGVVGFVLLTAVTTAYEKMIYRRDRVEFFHAVRAQGLDTAELFALLKDEEDYENLVEQMKSDADLLSF